MSVSGIFKKAADQGILDPAAESEAVKLGYTISYLERIMPSQETLEKVASKTYIPEGLIKAAILKKAFSLKPLLAVAGMAALPTIAAPMFRGIGKGVEKKFGKGSQGESQGDDMGSIGGIGPSEMKIYNRLIARQAMRNYQMRNLLDQMRMASGPVYGSSLFGQRTV